MSRVFVFAAALAAGFAMTCAAQAQTSGWYLSGDAGAYLKNDTTGPETFTKSAAPSVTAQGTNRTAFDPGIEGHVAVGYRFGPSLRVEIEVGAGGYSAKTLYPVTTNANFPNLDGAPYTRTSGGDHRVVTETVNAFYDFPSFAGRFTPYLGGGLGAVENPASVGVFTNASGIPFTQHGRAVTNGVGLAEAGVAVALAKRWSLTPAYRYEQGFGGHDGGTNIVKVGLRYAF